MFSTLARCKKVTRFNTTIRLCSDVSKKSVVNEWDIPPKTFQGNGIFTRDKQADVNQMVKTFTAPALAAALHDRERDLEHCSQLLYRNDLAGLKKILDPFGKKSSNQSEPKRNAVVPSRFDNNALNSIKKILSRMPRHIPKASTKRASVIVPICEVDGVPSVLFTRRSGKVSTHKHQVCFPGGMVDKEDSTIVDTSLREMEEEIGLPASSVATLGVLRCDWSEIEAITQVGVTPIVGFIGELSQLELKPNPDEVDMCFTVPLTVLADRSNWIERQFSAPVFSGGPHVIWGLTAYILKRLMIVMDKHSALSGTGVWSSSGARATGNRAGSRGSGGSGGSRGKTHSSTRHGGSGSSSGGVADAGVVNEPAAANVL